MKAKLLIILSVVALLPCRMMAQEGEQHIGVNLGFSDVILRARTQASSTKLDGKQPLYGFKAGVVYDATLVAGFGVQLGLNYTFGANVGNWQPINAFTTLRSRQDYIYHQLEIPIDWQYKFEIAKQTYLIVYTGPTIEIGLSLKQKPFVEQYKDGQVVVQQGTSQEMYDGDADNDGRRDYFRTNVTWGVGAGFQYKNYFLRGGYDFGITSPYRDRYYDPLSALYEGWNRKGRIDQWSIKLGMYIWQF
mgnify:CR=1 FL=1